MANNVLLLNRALKAAANIVYPPSCIFCGEFIKDGREIIICDKCGPSIPFLEKKSYAMKGFSFKRFSALFKYEGRVSVLIKRFKYHNHFEYAKPLAYLISSHIPCNAPDGADFLVPVPLHRARFRQRGFNQSEILACELSKNYDIPVMNNVLKRIKNTLPQYNLSREERLENINGAFMVENEEIVQNKVIVLVDDVFTTGSTLESCAKTLLYSGAKTVYCITIAMA